MKLLIIEDDENILSLLKDGFEEENYIVETADNGNDGEYLATTNHYDVIILDWMLPHISGIQILENLRHKKIMTSVIMLTAKDDVKNRVQGLNLGADDYLSKPFSFEELQARVEALFRRTSFNGSPTFQIQNITIDIAKKCVRQNGNIVNLTAKEYELLIFLVKNKNSYVSKFMIEEQLWSNQEFIASNVIEVIIFNLRKKLSKELIKNFKGLGYKIETH